jgi:hypothetical protein
VEIALLPNLRSAVLTSATAVLFTSAASFAQGIDLPEQSILDAQLAQLDQAVPGTIFAMQPFRNAQTLTGEDGTSYTLTSLNPSVNSWFILEITPTDGRARFAHFENGAPDTWNVSLIDEDGPTLLIEGEGDSFACAPWADGELEEAQSSALPFAPVCDWSLFVRNPVSGNRTTREAVAEFLRDNVVFGESIVNLIKGAFFEDAFMVSSEGEEEVEEIDGVALLGTALLERTPNMRPYMGFDLDGTDAGAMTAGSWYEVTDSPGIYASAMQPNMIANDVFQVPGANGLDGVERNADVYLVAFDMALFDIGYELGTEHPRLGWSSRPSNRHGQGSGPDGFNRPDPVVRTGMLSPAFVERVAATFTGGFKRDHGAWRFGDYSTFNYGHHYGFMQNGVLLSRLWPNLATMYLTQDGEVGMRTWSEEDDALLPELTFARQNGVPIIEDGVPGARVTSWGGGNWSGDANAVLRTLRGGACMRTVEGRQFLIYAYFSSATPSAMARTFQAYQCDYAMLLDMNSQEHTYMALYLHDEEGEEEMEWQHLVSGMAEADPDNGRIARFIGAPDNRDFFYLLRRQ